MPSNRYIIKETVPETGHEKCFLRWNPTPKCGSPSAESQVDALFRIIRHGLKNKGFEL
jgi:hypothetical protein